MEKGIGKLILKTCIYTLVLIFLVIFLALSIWAIASPSTASNFCKKTGMNKFSAVFACMEYDKTEDINDLATAVERCIIAENHTKMYLYGKKLIEHKEFEEFAEFMDEQFSDKMEIEGEYNYADYIYTNYVISLFKLGHELDACNVAMGRVVFGKYRETNPLRKVVNLAMCDSKKCNNILADINVFLQNKIIRMKPANIDGLYNEDIKLICEDGKRVAEKLGDTTAMQKFEAEYNAIIDSKA